MHAVLDLDLDVFSSPIVHWPQKNHRPSDCEYASACEDDVRYFLEEQCGLSRNSKLPGCEFIDHDEAFYTWRRWIEEGLLAKPFSISHVDAHADMGMGDAGSIYLSSELLAVPVEQRGNPRRANNALNAGNYLMFAVANHWVDGLTYIFPVRQPWTANWNSSTLSDSRHLPSDGPPEDLMRMYFRNEDWRTGMLELKHCSRDTLDRCMTRPLDPIIHKEPAVPFNFVPVPKFRFHGFTHMVVAQSPQYAPPSADKLLPILREYFTVR